MLLNKGQFVTEWNMHLVRKVAPVYQVPKSRIGRAHLFAPVKRLGLLYIGTYWFNLLAIWVSVIIFYISLYYDLLRKFTTWNQIRKLRKST